MKNQCDQIISKAFQENPILGALLCVMMDGGRVIATGDASESLLNMVPDVVFFERVDFHDMGFFSQLQPNDLVFIEQRSVDELWDLNHHCSAQIALISDKTIDPTLADFFVTESYLRSAFLEVGSLWKQVQTSRKRGFIEGSLENKALFLDRDGVVIEDTNYVKDASSVTLRPTVGKALKIAQEQGYRLIVVTNQSGIGREIISWRQYENVTHRMQELLCKEGVFFDRILRAPFYEKSGLASGLVRKSLRKPRPGMIHSAVQEFRIDLSASILVGDSATDLMSGALVGIKNLYLMDSVKCKEELEKWRNWPLLSRTNTGIKPPVLRNLTDLFKS